jgi:hypothetical protein
MRDIFQNEIALGIDDEPATRVLDPLLDLLILGAWMVAGRCQDDLAEALRHYC